VLCLKKVSSPHHPAKRDAEKDESEYRLRRFYEILLKADRVRLKQLTSSGEDKVDQKADQKDVPNS